MATVDEEVAVKRRLAPTRRFDRLMELVQPLFCDIYDTDNISFQRRLLPLCHIHTKV
jgi:hypothetical protein